MTTESEARKLRAAIYELLLEKLPTLDLGWPNERQEKWWCWLDEIITALYDH